MSKQPARALITGGTKGMGLATAVRVAREVDEVVLVYRSDEEAAHGARRAVEAEGASVTLVRGDIAEESTFTQLAQVLATSTAPLALVLHAAVDTSPVDLLNSDFADVERCVAANALSTIRLARTVDDHMTEGSLMVFLSSKGATATIAGYAGIGVPKAMSESVIRYLAAQWASRGTRALTVAPGAVDTGSFRAAFANADAYLAGAAQRTPMGRLATPDDVAGTIVALMGADLGMVTGERLLIDGGVGLL